MPTIDLRGPCGLVAAAIDAACRDVGFFQIVGHDVDEVLESGAWATAAEFFRLPEEAKAPLTIRDGEAYGYGPFRAERLAASRGVATPPDLKETFSIGPPPRRPSGVDDPAASFVFSETPWPIDLPTMPAIMSAYYDELAALVARLMSLMASALGLRPDAFAHVIDRHTSALRLLHYPDLREDIVEAGQLRAGAHSDYGTLTLLRQDDAPGGLQVRDVRGAWHDVPAVPGAYVVNVGDALERWTNDRWRSTVHRVVVPPPDLDRDGARQSIAFFHNANWDAVIECLPGCLEPGSLPTYPPVTAGRHLMDKFRSTQEHEATDGRVGGVTRWQRKAERHDRSAERPVNDHAHRIRTFKPRRRQLTPARAALYERLRPWWCVDVEGEEFDAVAVFGREAPLVLDIGIGFGDSLTTAAADEPDIDVIGADVHTPGIASTLARIEEMGLSNVRLLHGDALRFVERLDPGALAGIRIYFPDPWHKARHRNRRMASAANIDRFGRLLARGGTLHVATDIDDYAVQVRRLCDEHPAFQGGVIERPATRPETRYERKGLDAGRGVTDLLYVKC